MLKVKSFILNNKKIMIILAVSILLIGLCIGSYFIFSERPNKAPSKSEENIVEKTYTMYVKINPLVKLTLKESYTECVDEDGTKSICGGTTNSVIDYELINDDAKEFYKDLNFNGKTVLDVLVMLCDVARENNVGFEKLEITSDWENLYNVDEIEKALNKNSKYEYDISIYVDFTEQPEKSEILEEMKKYTVIFESNGGSKVDAQEVIEKAKVTKPEDPTKEGYKFIEWQLNKKKYDFEQEVTNNITLKAKWEKQKETTNETKNNQETPKEDNKIETNNKQENNNTTSESKKEENKLASTINKVNLNENFMIYETTGTGTMCSYYMFAANVETVLAGYVSNKTIELYAIPEEYQSKYSELTYDTAKEAQAIKELESLKNQLPTFFAEFNYWNNEHKMGYRYDTITLVEGNLGQFSNDWEAKRNNFKNKLKTIFADAYLFMGACGTGPEEKLLDEAVCRKYNLTCDRW